MTPDDKLSLESSSSSSPSTLSADQAQAVDPDQARRARAIQRTTLSAIVINSLLTVGQILVGIAANAWSLVADAMHTLSDLVTDFLVLIAGRRGAQPADRDHPYGHGRIETVVSMLLGTALLMVGVGFLWSSGDRLQHLDEVPQVEMAAIWMALFTLLAKELLFRYMLAAGRKWRSRLLISSAWHARSDAASSLVVAVGIGGSLMGYRFLEPLAAALVGFMILRVGGRFVFEAVRELIDTGLPEAEVASIRATLRATPGVVGLHELRTRRMANRVLCDAHVQVSPRISVSEGHRVAELARFRVREAHPEVLDVLVHVDAENDGRSEAQSIDTLPDRATLIEEVSQLLDGAVPERVLIHYLGRQVELEIFLPESWLQQPQALDALKARVRSIVEGRDEIRRISLNVHLASQ